MDAAAVIGGIVALAILVLLIVVTVYWITFPITVAKAFERQQAQMDEVLKALREIRMHADRTSSSTFRPANFFSNRNVELRPGQTDPPDTHRSA